MWQLPIYDILVSHSVVSASANIYSTVSHFCNVPSDGRDGFDLGKGLTRDLLLALNGKSHLATKLEGANFSSPSTSF